MDAVDVVIGVLRRGDRILICRRRRHDRFGGLWEFPGGKRLPGESNEQCLSRELVEELGLEARPIQSLAPIEFDYGTFVVRLHPYFCDAPKGEPRPLACDELAWIAPGDLPTYAFPQANEPLIRLLMMRCLDSSSMAP